MAFKRGTDRKQTVLFPESLDEYVAADSPVRLIDTFADSLDMIALGLHRVEPDDIGADDRQGTRRVLRQGRRAKPGHLPARRDTAAEVLEEKRRHQVLQQAGLQALQVKVHHVQVQGGGLLEGLSDQESRREERRRQARRQRTAIEVGDRKRERPPGSSSTWTRGRWTTANAFRNIRSEPSSGQSARASSCCAGCSRQRAGWPCTALRTTCGGQ